MTFFGTYVNETKDLILIETLEEPSYAIVMYLLQLEWLQYLFLGLSCVHVVILILLFYNNYFTVPSIRLIWPLSLLSAKWTGTMKRALKLHPSSMGMYNYQQNGIAWSRSSLWNFWWTRLILWNRKIRFIVLRPTAYLS